MIVEKPWGKVTTYALNQPSSVRMITIEPGQETSGFLRPGQARPYGYSCALQVGEHCLGLGFARDLDRVAAQLAGNPRGTALRIQLQARQIPVEEVADRDFESAAETESPQGILAVSVVPEARIGSKESSPVPGHPYFS